MRKQADAFNLVSKVISNTCRTGRRGLGAFLPEFRTGLREFHYDRDTGLKFSVVVSNALVPGTDPYAERSIGPNAANGPEAGQGTFSNHVIQDLLRRAVRKIEREVSPELSDVAAAEISN